MPPPTIKDVARRAGVSHSTVSRVLNDRLRMPISPATIERIRQAARELEYVPHAAARALAERRTQTIGFICPEISNPYYGTLAEAVQLRLEARGYLLIVCSARSQAEREAHYTRLLGESRVDGLLVLGATSASESVVRQLQKQRGIPIVAAGPPMLPGTRDVFTACVAHDQVRGGFLVGQHLGALGHARIGYTAVGGLAQYHGAQRLEGLRAGLTASGAGEVVRLAAPVENTPEGGFQAATALFEAYPDLTALFANNDRVALGALRALRCLGRHCPEDVSLVGYQDLDLAAYTCPSLTTVRIPVQRIAELATDLLLQAVEGAAIAEPQVVVQPELVVRESTAPPRR